MRHENSGTIRLLMLLFAIASLSIAAVACGSDGDGDSDDGVGSSSDGPIAKIDATERIYTADDIKNTEFFKTDDDYDVEGLDGAVAAVYGFYGSDPYKRDEYEARFYADHAAAMAQGVDFADEATGADAVLLKDIQRWDEGISDRRQCAGNGGHHSGKCDNPKYFDYIVVGNMVLMCQGKDTAESHQACANLMAVVQ
ncbi:MAG TPA: hypothetical protein QF694_08235 [Dehalococcoidia bacterium]|jgi:hypothetical protein|nr:hypothetical protein [Chloroflexota bacterium]MDP6056469.1 hypothetical protein [Dehalococcoidia bacterium]MDP7261096.1 hypothetical protein [Dehalococcoidia bacterium]HJP28783.1 hypothetical protein [Dehalococcoidia bacterium]|tara:strand:- start:1630 stop:2220 length:591 start_codon:yes stop_codon:yes gene_type:complete